MTIEEDDVVYDQTLEDNDLSQLNTKDRLKLIANALKANIINSAQAALMRSRIGVFHSRFTKPQIKGTIRKAKRKAQRRSRLQTKRFGYRGQKPPSGRRKAA